MFIPRILSIVALLTFSGARAQSSPRLRFQAGTPPYGRYCSHEQTGVPGKEVPLGTTVIPAGAAIRFHTHAGDEFGYVLKGPLMLVRPGEPNWILPTAAAFFNPRGVVHGLATGSDDGMAVSIWVIDKGHPLFTPLGQVGESIPKEVP
jgi:quercetin dioxygenase-like cupin family protein